MRNAIFTVVLLLFHSLPFCASLAYAEGTQRLLQIEVKRPFKSTSASLKTARQGLRSPRVQLAYQRGGRVFKVLRPGSRFEHRGGIWAHAVDNAVFWVTRLDNPVRYGSSKWYYLPEMPTESSLRFNEIYKEWPTLGRRRGHEDIISPTRDGVVWPERFEARWTPLAEGSQVTLAVYESKDEETAPLWRVTGVPGDQGQLDAEEARQLRQVLMRWQTTHPSPPVLQLKIESDDKPDSSSVVFFMVLSESQEIQLKRELWWWQQRTGGTVRLLGESLTLLKANLVYDAALRCRQASDAHPDSLFLREKAEQLWEVVKPVPAHDNSGN